MSRRSGPARNDSGGSPSRAAPRAIPGRARVHREEEHRAKAGDRRSGLAVVSLLVLVERAGR
eukprot:11195978-Lingulodinium_polyedra.AAC.1